MLINIIITILIMIIKIIIVIIIITIINIILPSYSGIFCLTSAIYPTSEMPWLFLKINVVTSRAVSANIVLQYYNI